MPHANADLPLAAGGREDDDGRFDVQLTGDAAVTLDEAGTTVLARDVHTATLNIAGFVAGDQLDVTVHDLTRADVELLARVATEALDAWPEPYHQRDRFGMARTLTAEQVAEARGWLVDSGLVTDAEDADALTDRQVERAISRHYVGGLFAFTVNNPPPVDAQVLEADGSVYEAHPRNGTEHSHTFEGQTLVHAHEHAAPHGYYEHPEDVPLTVEQAAPAHQHTDDCMSPWAERGRQHMSPGTVAMNHQLHMRDPDGDPQ